MESGLKLAAVGGIWDVLEVLLDTAVVEFLGIAGGEEEVKDGVREAELFWEAGSQQAAGNSLRMFALK